MKHQAGAAMKTKLTPPSPGSSAQRRRTGLSLARQRLKRLKREMGWGGEVGGVSIWGGVQALKRRRQRGGAGRSQMSHWASEKQHLATRDSAEQEQVLLAVGCWNRLCRAQMNIWSAPCGWVTHPPGVRESLAAAAATLACQTPPLQQSAAPPALWRSGPRAAAVSSEARGWSVPNPARPLQRWRINISC